MKIMVIETDKGTIECSLATAGGVDNTIAHFEKRANDGLFDGLMFHRVENWVIQGGDPTGTGSGGGKITAEYNSLPFYTGALGVARGPDKRLNSDCQFFIVKTDSTFLDRDYTNFGQVISGMDVVKKIASRDKMNRVRVEDRAEGTQ
ncbi:MAG TPA: peptidylprolyl isomerase [Chloroflexia bacterium]